MGGLLAARELGISTGGIAPHGWMTEAGSQEAQLKSFGLTECEETGYPPRTRLNVSNSDGTLLIGDYRTGGSRLTYDVVRELNKPVFLLPYSKPFTEHAHIAKFRDWLAASGVQVLNVAGNRESDAPGIEAFTRSFLLTAFQS